MTQMLNKKILNNEILITEMLKKKSAPDFLGIGYPKTGTTWVYESLKSHPNIFMAEHPHVKFKKEINFWSNYRGDETISPDDYFKLFFNKPNKIKGEFSVTYVYPEVLLAIKKLLKTVKIICGFKNPIDCIISSHLHQIRNSPDKKNINFFDYYENNKSFLENSYNYDEIFFLCEELFKEDFFYYFFQELKNSPTILIKNIYKFLNVDSDFLPSTVNHKINSRYEFKSRIFHRFNAELSRKINNMQSLISPTYHSNFLIKFLLKLNQAKPKKTDPKIKNFLIGIYEPKCKNFLKKFDLDINLPF